MQRISNWEARRAGGRITIYGRDEDGHPTKVVGVDKITAGRKRFTGRANPIATDKNAVEYELV